MVFVDYIQCRALTFLYWFLQLDLVLSRTVPSSDAEVRVRVDEFDEFVSIILLVCVVRYIFSDLSNLYS
jgi:hypothetical protein